VLLELVRNTIRPGARTDNPEEIVRKACLCFQAERSKDLGGLIAEKLDSLRHYDVQGMDRVVAIVMWGRSGSILLASYFDGHEDVITLPESDGYLLQEFFERYEPLPFRDKLLAYAVYEPSYTRFFAGDFAISRTQYYAAVQAILEFSDGWPAEFLESRRAFFLFVHIAYQLALGRRPGSSRPLIVYAQHFWDSTLARRLVEDFPEAKFIHTIRDPISACDSFFHNHVNAVERFILLPFSALNSLANKDQPQPGVEARTRTVRFEDLHSYTADTMRGLADWLELDYQPSLLESTFNGIPYVVKRDGSVWSGPRLEQLQRQSRHLSFKDRALLFALFYENFRDWNYPCPKIFRHRTVRCVTFLSLFLLPTKMEITSSKVVFKRNIVPAVRQRKMGPIVASLVRIVWCRLQIIRRLGLAFLRRCARRPLLLQTVRMTPQESGNSSATACNGKTVSREASASR